MKINSHNEWDTLKEVVLGTMDSFHTALEFSSSFPVSEDLIKKASDIARMARPQSYVDEVNEDLSGLKTVLTNFGAKVFHPKGYRADNLFCTPNWCAMGKDIYNVRDLHLIVGDTVIVGSSSTRARYFEPDAFSDIWYHYFDEGFRWVAAPRPKLIGNIQESFYEKGKEQITSEDIKHRALSGGRGEEFYRLTEDEILFDAANSIRLGRDLLYLVSSTGNWKGAKWLAEILGADYRVHTTSTYRSSHIDSTILPIRPGLVLLNSARVHPDHCPTIFKEWDKIYFEDVATVPIDELEFQKNVRDKAFKKLQALNIESDLNHISSPWAGLNIFSLDENTVLVHDRQTKLIRELERRKLTVIPIRMRHCYTMLGGLHCATLDTVRDGELENYFD